MHKFTIFTIIFSAIVIITVSELVVSDYLGRKDGQEPSAQEEVAVAQDDGPEQSEADLVSFSTLDSYDYTSLGFPAGSALKSKNFPDNVFQFLEYNDDSAESYYWELFSGEEYLGGLYEIVCKDPTEAFTVYTDLKQSAMDQPSAGTVNEVNNYGEASFYFNDNVKTTSIFIVILGENRVFAFNYGSAYHNDFKGLFTSLK